MLAGKSLWELHPAMSGIGIDDPVGFFVLSPGLATAVKMVRDCCCDLPAEGPVEVVAFDMGACPGSRQAG